MATRTRSGNENVNAAIAVLLHTQAQFVAELAETRKEFAAIRQDLDTIKAVLVRHDETLNRHEQILNRQEQMLKDLPEAIRQKIGFAKR